MKCKYCQSELNGANYCPNCGAPAPVEEVFNREVEKQSVCQEDQKVIYNSNKGSILGILAFLFCITFILGFVGVILAIKDLKRKDGKKKTLSVIALLIFVVYSFFAVCSFINYEVSLDEPELVATEQLIKDGLYDESEIKEVTVKQLYNELDEDKELAYDTYFGEYIELTGRMNNVDEKSGYFSLSIMSEEWSLDSVLCYVDEEELEIVKEFPEEGVIVVRGIVTDASSVLGYMIEVVEIVNY